ncbi:unnamed protein product [Parnassius apollo]|uniref:(apollo) hypothetical protein n=1 Tax=Parnassius apollo TaxID=110799 RepID=A0A8S3YBU4_PARAO|nr:unnamed protein product [Parnassius apollo]
MNLCWKQPGKKIVGPATMDDSKNISENSDSQSTEVSTIALSKQPPTTPMNLIADSADGACQAREGRLRTNL